MNKRFVAIGHIVENTAKPKNLIGGGVVYSGIAARELGLDVEIITKIPKQHRFIEFLANRGVDVVLLPTRSTSITTSTNIYDSDENRQQFLLDRQEDITRVDLDAVPPAKYTNAIFLVAPDMWEVDAKIIPFLSKYGQVVVLAQGYFRDVDKNGKVSQKDWKGFEDDLSEASLTFLSEEDISVNGAINQELLDRIKASSPVTVLTRGSRGAKVYLPNKEIQVSAFPLNREQTKDFTGAGDVFAAAYLAKFAKTGKHKDAAVVASFFAAVKIAGIGGLGVDSIPTLRQLEQFKNEHYSEIKIFLDRNGATEGTLKI